MIEFVTLKDLKEITDEKLALYREWVELGIIQRETYESLLIAFESILLLAKLRGEYVSPTSLNELRTTLDKFLNKEAL
jgi:hypothetical protein